MVHAGVKVGGLRERHTQHFEASPAAAERFFPNDYVTSCEYGRYITQTVAATQAKWERTPPAKRFNYKIVEDSEGFTYNRWNPDWSYLLNLDDSRHVATGEPSTQSAFIPAQPLITQTPPAALQSSGPIQPWLLLGTGIRSLVQSMVAAVTTDTRAQDVLHSRILEVREKRGLKTNFCVPPDGLFSSAFISVNVYMIGRGCPKDNAVVYELNPEQMIQERKRHKKGGRGSPVGNEGVDVSDEHFLPSHVYLARQFQVAGALGQPLGFVTTGRFSLSRGRGHAIATISLSALIRILRTFRYV